jgi:hypothetical protein
MKKRNIFVLLVAIVLSQLGPSAATAAEDADARMEKIEAQLRALQEELAALKAERAAEKAQAAREVPPLVDQTQLEELVNKTFEENKDDFTKVPEWVERLKWSGDFRYRYENIHTEESPGDRNRNRIRARLRLDAKVNDEWDAIFRVATAEVDTDAGGIAKGSRSTNVTLDNEFRQKNLWLDWAYAAYHPESMPGLDVWLGKMGTPLYKVGKNQLIYDNDLAWEGGAVKYKMPLNDNQALLLNWGGFYLEENDGADIPDASLWTTQVALEHKMDDMTLTGGVGYYHFGNVEWADLSDPNVGTSPDFDDTFNLVEIFGELSTSILDGGLPLSVYASYVNNAGTDSDADTAWIVGTKLGKAKKRGSWEVGYNYRDTEADAVSPTLSDSDFIGGGVDGRGHEFKAKYQLHKNVQAALTYILAERDRAAGDDLDYDRLMLDLIFKF